MIARHDQLLDVLYEAASGASLAPVREERHLLPGSAARPGDLLIRRWADGKDHKGFESEKVKKKDF